MKKIDVNSVSYQIAAQSARSLAVVAAVFISIALYLEADSGMVSAAESHLENFMLAVQ
jgi:hypothetical protein